MLWELYILGEAKLADNFKKFMNKLGYEEFF
jgi:hypothetical protein